MSQAPLPCPNPWCQGTMIVQLTSEDGRGGVAGTRRMCGYCKLMGPVGATHAEALAKWNERPEVIVEGGV